MTKRVLFVDDSPNVLSALRRMLHGQRHEWDMKFANDGAEALELMEHEPFDVVVADMRMPGMDGAELLTETMKRHPSTVRIVLSGQADPSSVLRAVTPAHVYLTKPCDAETLKATVDRACSLRDRLSQQSLIDLVSQVTTLPSLPSVYAKLIETLNSEDASVQDVAKLITQDIGMTAKLMQMVNSSFFGMPRRIESPEHAAALLGLNTLRPLVFSAGIFSQFSDASLPDYSLDALVEHSLAVSHLAQEITLEHTGEKHLAEEALLAGAVHDVGQLVQVANQPGEFHKALRLAKEKEIPLYEAEMEVMGAHHANIGAYLVGLWGMADPIVEAIAFHHEPSGCAATEFAALTAVHVANALINEQQPSCDITLAVELDNGYLERIGVADRVPAWREMAEEFLSTRQEECAT